MKHIVAAIAIVAFLAGAAFAQSTGRTAGERVDDAQITAKVKAKLAADRAATLLKVDVDTRDGVVRLQGTVPTDTDRTEAERLAMQIEGVKTVTNDLKVRTAGAASPSR